MNGPSEELKQRVRENQNKMKKNKIKKRTLNELRQVKTYGYRPPLPSKEKDSKNENKIDMKAMEQYANQRVVEELEKIKGLGITYTDDAIDKRIKELKQTVSEKDVMDYLR